MKKTIFYMFAVALLSCCATPLLSQKKVKDRTPIPQDTARQIRINKIFIIGNDKTKEYIITRELSFAEGDTIPEYRIDEVIQQSRNNVYNTNLFSTVTLEKLEQDSNTVDVLIKLEERWYVWPSFVLRPIDRNPIDWWVNRGKDLSRVRFGPKLDIYNLRGRKESLRLIALFGFDRTLITQYSIPYIDKNQKHGLTFGASSVTNKKMPYETIDHINYYITDTSEFVNQVNREAWSGFVIYKYRPSFYNYHYLTVQGYGMTISDDVAQLNPDYFGNGATSQNAFGLTYSFVNDRRDNRNYPLSGHYFYGAVEKLGLGIYNDVDIWRFDGLYQHYIDLDQGWYFSASIGTQITSPNSPYFNYTQFGDGTYYVRGFEQYIVEGPQNVLTKNSIKKRVFDTKFDLGKFMPIKKFRKIPFTIYAKAFTDAGYVNNYPNYEQSSRLTNKPLYSMGVGLDIVLLYDITLRLEYSYNSEGEFKFAPNFMAEL